ncbi:MAG TPA: hypothetical protein VEY30_09140 [Myxococcaceae bacterium]|nr:hypothetical protein [Myxococcaceae bacterium]
MLLSSPATVELPHGLYDVDGGCHRRAELRLLTGHEELLVASAGVTLSHRAENELLTSCVSRVGQFSPFDASLAAALTRGDRHYLALRLRAQLFGDPLALVARCAAPSCGALVDLSLRISALVSERPEPAPEHIEVTLPEGVASVREPTGEDDAWIESQDATRAEKSALLWSRLVELEGQPLTPAQWKSLPAPSRHRVAMALAEEGSAPDLALLSRCLSCGAWLELELDPFGILLREVGAGIDRLEAEVHCLAFHYHWSEEQILSLPRPRRWRYLEFLCRELEGRPLVEGLGGLA